LHAHSDPKVVPQGKKFQERSQKQVELNGKTKKEQKENIEGINPEDKKGSWSYKEAREAMSPKKNTQADSVLEKKTRKTCGDKITDMLKASQQQFQASDAQAREDRNKRHKDFMDVFKNMTNTGETSTGTTNNMRKMKRKLDNFEAKVSSLEVVVKEVSDKQDTILEYLKRAEKKKQKKVETEHSLFFVSKYKYCPNRNKFTFFFIIIRFENKKATHCTQNQIKESKITCC